MAKLSSKNLFKAVALSLSLLAFAGCGGGGTADKKEAAKPAAPTDSKIVQVKSEKAADLEAAAKKEGKLKIYSITSRVTKAGAAFEKKYGIKVEATDMKDFELIDKISSEVKAKADGADMVIAQDSVVYTANYFPPVICKIMCLQI